jgi:hypothetical protein
LTLLSKISDDIDNAFNHFYKEGVLEVVAGYVGEFYDFVGDYNPYIIPSELEDEIEFDEGDGLFALETATFLYENEHDEIANFLCYDVDITYFLHDLNRAKHKIDKDNIMELVEKFSKYIRSLFYNYEEQCTLDKFKTIYKEFLEEQGHTLINSVDIDDDDDYYIEAMPPFDKQTKNIIFNIFVEEHKLQLIIEYGLKWNKITNYKVWIGAEGFPVRYLVDLDNNNSYYKDWRQEDISGLIKCVLVEFDAGEYNEKIYKLIENLEEEKERAIAEIKRLKGLNFSIDDFNRDLNYIKNMFIRDGFSAEAAEFILNELTKE